MSEVGTRVIHTVRLRDRAQFASLLDERGLSRADVARLARVSKTTITHLMQGRKRTRPKTAARIARAVRQDPGEIFTDRADITAAIPAATAGVA